MKKDEIMSMIDKFTAKNGDVDVEMLSLYMMQQDEEDAMSDPKKRAAYWDRIAEENKKNKGKFYMVYAENFEKHSFYRDSKLSVTKINVLMHVLSNMTMCGDYRFEGGNIVVINKRVREDLMKKLKCQKNIIDKAVSDFCKYHIMRPVAGVKGVYQVNPYLFACGKTKDINSLRKAYDPELMDGDSAWRDGDIPKDLQKNGKVAY